jgi:hypothetical protein
VTVDVMYAGDLKRIPRICGVIPGCYRSIRLGMFLGQSVSPQSIVAIR